MSTISGPPLEPTARPDSRGTPCTQAKAGRRAWHLVITIAGWALFIYWWIIVLRRVTRAEVSSTLVFITAATLVSIGIIAIWTHHNRRIFAQRGNRRAGVKVVMENYTHDVLGRVLRFEPRLAELRRASLVRIRIEGDTKVCALDASRAGTATAEEAAAAS